MSPLGIVVTIATVLGCGVVWLVVALGDEAMVLWFLFNRNEKPPRPGKGDGQDAR